MGRRVEAILLGLERARDMGDVLRAPMLVSEVTAFLKNRFDPESLRVQALQNEDATKSAVLAALRSACEAFKDGTAGLFVLAFSGHGGKRDGDGHTWRLFDTSLTDRELATALAELPANVEVVLISDCCYGLGILRPGVQFGRDVVPVVGVFDDSLRSAVDATAMTRLKGWFGDEVRKRIQPHLVLMPEDLLDLRDRLRSSIRLLAATPASEAGKPVSLPGRDIVCLASAVSVLVATDTRNRFAEYMRAAMESPSPPAIYDVLDDKMEKDLEMRGEHKKEQHEWIVEADPTSAADLPPFAP